MGRGVGCGFGGPQDPVHVAKLENAPKVVIDKGRFLLDPATQTVVGCTTGEASARNPGDGTLLIATIFGELAVQLAPEELDKPCGTIR